MLPHLSHNDGKKIDIAFQYKTPNEQPTNKKPSLFVYGNFVKSMNPTTKRCMQQGHWHYDITKYLNFVTNKNLEFDPIKTKQLILCLLKHTKNQRLFLEPYLKTTMGLENYKSIRFHGCQAVRHDDHIHLEIR